MRKSLFSIVAASVLFAGIGLASAQMETKTNTWTTEQGAMIREYSTTQKYVSYTDPAMRPAIGMEVPGTVTVYSLPESMKIVPADRYSYSIINNQPIIMERTTRKVVHVWE